MIKPTIGRKVWLFAAAGITTLGTIVKNSDQPFDATVVHVWGDRCVNLRCTDHAGNSFALTSVTLLQDDDAAPETGWYAQWMPYQQAQASKAEAVEKANEDHGGD